MTVAIKTRVIRNRIAMMYKSQADFCEAARISPQGLNAIFRKGTCRYQTAYKLSRTLGCDIECILEEASK